MAGLALPLVWNAPARSQQTVISADDGTAVADGVIVLGHVIIEGEKIPREQSETYASFRVVTSEAIDNLNLKKMNDDLNILANVRFLPSGTGDTNFSIRGLNAEGGTQPSRSTPIIQVSVDGALQGVEATRLDSRGIWDVDQIEVFRRPLSTLQGRNALGGVVIINTKDPVLDTYEVKTQGEVGIGEYFSGAVVANLPLIEHQVAGRLAAQIRRSKNGINYKGQNLEELG